MLIIKTISLCLLFLIWHTVHTVTVGSDATPSRQALTTFSGSPNIMLGFASFEKGVILTDANTSCSYDCFLPVSGRIKLNNGRLYLRQDLTISNTVIWQNGGRIFGNNRSMTISDQTTTFSFGATNFTDISLKLKGNFTISSNMTFNGTCKIAGNGNRLTLGSNTKILVRPNSTLIFENVQVRNLKTENLACMNDSGSITLQNTSLALSTDYNFTNGAISFNKDNLITGTSKFSYSARRTSTIELQSILTLDRLITFSYSPRVAKRTLINFTDATSTLNCLGCTIISTRTGLQLDTGRLIFDGSVTFSSQAKNRGEGASFGTNLTVNVLGASTVNLFGHFRSL